jgi:hypothetical protein
MLGHGARRWGILPAESIPWDGVRDLRRELESSRFAKALSARLLEKLGAFRPVTARRLCVIAGAPQCKSPVAENERHCFRIVI